jgi:hypothetical protein
MTLISYPKNVGLRRGALAAFAACALILAASQGVAVRAQAEDARADYVAPLDMDSTYADAIESPGFWPNASGRRSMAARDTTGVNSAPSASGRMDAAASPQDATNAYPDDIYKFAP